jgi:4-carboxymuconolactone decarboxylase
MAQKPGNGHRQSHRLSFFLPAAVTRLPSPAYIEESVSMTVKPTPPSPTRDKVRATVPKLIDLTEKVVYGDVWERTELSKRDRSLITCAALVVLNRSEQLKGHLERALNNGVTPEEIGELITHLAFYGGWPVAMSSAMVAKDVLEQRKK